MVYAIETKVSVVKTQGDIREMVNRAGASMFAIMEDHGRAQIAFHMHDRNIRFSVKMPSRSAGETPAQANRREKVLRSRWRSLLLVIKAKLESVDSGIETFEEAFLSHVQMPSGQTVYEEMKEPLALRYREKSNIPLLAGPQ
jgi:hypothetical protein